MMERNRQDASDYLEQVAAAVLRVMRKHAQLRLDDLRRKVDAIIPTSLPSLRRACTWLRETHDAPLRYDGRLRMWVLERRDFSLPLLDPTADDIVAVAFAGALLSPIGDPDLDRRIQSLLMELDERVAASGRSRKLRSHAVMATSSATMPVDPRVVGTLATAVGREVVRIKYCSPWREEPAMKNHVIEPWQLRVHDGNLYVRGWLRKNGGPATFRVSQIHSIVVTGERPDKPRPPPHEIWGDEGPGKNVDIDRPDRATVRIRGPMARYVGSTIWHEDQTDTWIEKDRILQRTFSYESCRATARRLLGLGDALVHVEPDTLRTELATHVAALSKLT
jgi:predicted DNA-binding transcriptional regulator YafY